MAYIQRNKTKSISPLFGLPFIRSSMLGSCLSVAKEMLSDEGWAITGEKPAAIGLVLSANLSAYEKQIAYYMIDDECLT